MAVSAGASLRALREARPLVHQITNYVVMNETANATLAIGALPVMAHAGEEVEEMARLASSLVLNIGTLSGPWVEAMLLAGRTASARRIPVVLSVEDVTLLLRAASGPKYKAAFATAYGAGLRVSEVVARSRSAISTPSACCCGLSRAKDAKACPRESGGPGRSPSARFGS